MHRIETQLQHVIAAEFQLAVATAFQLARAAAIRTAPVMVVFLVLAGATTAAAQPAHCERATGHHAWPAPGEAIDGADPTPVTAAEARRAVAAFRIAWRSVRHPSAVLRAFTECMNASSEHFVVRRVSAVYARRAVAQLAAGPFASLLLSGSASTLPATGWVWEIYWGGASRRFPPSGPVSAYFSPDLRTLLAAVQWPEG